MAREGAIPGEVDVLVGLHRGDEGKGRFVDMLTADYDYAARFGGGNNAGHTVFTPEGLELKLHTLPSGIARPEVVNIIGSGVMVQAASLYDEIEQVRSKGLSVTEANLMISSAAHLILPHYILEDSIREAGSGKQGSTKSGISQTAAAKAKRENSRAEMIMNNPEGLFEKIVSGLTQQTSILKGLELDPETDERLVEERARLLTPGYIERAAKEYIERARTLGGYITDTVLFLNQQLGSDTPPRVIAEGAQAFLLDENHGMYPYTTSSTTTSGGVSPGLGIPPRYIGKVYGVFKAIQSHVGGGHFVTEELDETLLDELHGDMDASDAEKGTVTNRVRRLGHIDIPQLRRANMVNGTDEMLLTKLDWVNRYPDSIRICVDHRRKGKQLPVSTDAGYKLEQSEPIYVELDTWKDDISGVREFKDLPVAAQRYVEFIEEKTDVPITMIGVGQRRDQVIIR